MRRLCTAFVLSAMLGLPAAAQRSGAINLTRAPELSDSARAVRMIGNAVRPPTQFVLDHRADLALSDSQIVALTRLQAALADSVVERRARMLGRLQANVPKVPTMARVLMRWEGPLDEEVVKAESCEQSKRTAESTLELLRDRILVGALLTAEQRAKLMPLQAADMTKIMQP